MTCCKERAFQRFKKRGLQHEHTHVVGSLKMNTTLEYSTRVVQEGDRRCKKSTLNDLAYLTPLRIPLMNPVNENEVRPKKGWQKSHRFFFLFI